MGIVHSSDKQRGLTYIVWDGEVIRDDWLRHMEDLLKDPDWRAMPRFIADLQSVTNSSTIQDKAVELAAVVIAENREALARKTGAIVASEEFWRAQKFGGLLERFGTSTVVFNTLDTACLFLGIDLLETRQALEQLRSKLRLTTPKKDEP